jgi:hypothetical protein
MEKLIYLTLLAALTLSGCAEEPEKEEIPGGIYGIISDKATGEPVKSAGVQLNPTGTKTITGSEGQYEFTELKAGEYKVSVTKTAYTDLLDYKITVAAGKTAKGDVQLEKLPASLRVVNDKKQEIDSLNFGSAAADITRSFSIFNDGPESIEWQVTETSEWITGVSKIDGILKAGATQAVIVTIDRDLLDGGENTTTIHVTSDNGSKELIATAIGENKTLPVLNTLEATNITATTATFNGEITAAGLPAYTERGFVYDTLTMPTIETTIAKKTVAVDQETTFFSNVTELEINKTYYVRAYAKNSIGTAYSSNEFVFQTIVGMPQVSTRDVSNKNIAAGTCTFNGAIDAVGDPAYTERGFVYGITHNPTVGNDTIRVASGSGTGAFSFNANNIAEGSVYYVRAYATNISGTAYGTEVETDFTATMPVVATNAITNRNIANGTATFNGNIASLGDLTCTKRGFVYATVTNPTIDDEIKEVSGMGTGSFSGNVSGLQLGNIYHIRAFVTNSKGTVYGDNAVLDFNAAMPQVSTQAVSAINVNNGTATFSGTIINIGDPAYTERGFVYATTNNPTIVNGTKRIVAGNGTGAFSYNETGITTDVIYYLRAYATNSVSTVYGDEVSFVLAASLPQVTTQAITNKSVGAGTATFNGAIVGSGSPVYTEKGFVYAATHNPTTNNTKIVSSGSGTGAFSVNATNIAMGSVYYVRAYATNVSGTSYGEEVSVDFNAISPVLTTQAVTNISIGNGTATFNATIASVGDPAYTEKGFVYATTNNPTIDDTKNLVSGTGSGTFSANITGIAEGHVYYVRAYAISNNNATYGAEISFDFNAVLPEVSTLSISGIDVTVATLRGNIIRVGNPALIERGFVYSTTINPTVTNATKAIAAGTSAGNYSLSISSLTTGNTYHVRAYATTAFATVYGEDISFTAEQQPFVELTSAGIAVSRVNTTASYQVVNWVNANSACESSALGGFTDWRVPTVAELQVIYQNKNRFENLHERTNFQITDDNGLTAYVYDMYWSSNYDGLNYYKVFSFYNGTSTGSVEQTHSYQTSTNGGKNTLIGFYCRCVRTLP